MWGGVTIIGSVLVASAGAIPDNVFFVSPTIDWLLVLAVGFGDCGISGLLCSSVVDEVSFSSCAIFLVTRSGSSGCGLSVDSTFSSWQSELLFSIEFFEVKDSFGELVASLMLRIPL